MSLKKKEVSYKIWLPLLLAISTAIGMLVGYRMSSENFNDSDMVSGLSSKSQQEKTLEEILKYIDNKYVDSIDQKVLVEAATNAMLDQLDPHSVYISPEQIADVNEGMSGFYKGMGIETVYLDDTLRVVRVLGESPAEKAGITYGDLITTVNDSLLAGQGRERDEQWEMLRATSDLTFNLGIIDKDGKSKEAIVTPEKIKAPNVDFFEHEGTAYINILRFSDKTYEGIVDALESLQDNKIIDKLILDLRNNPGGYLPEATKILNQLFVEDKRLLVYTEDRTKRKTEYKTTGRPFYQINKLVILVNEGSASASEIIAGALQDWDKAIIVGKETFGKGLVQEQFSLSNGGAVRLTTARYYTPSGRSIQTPYDETHQDSSLMFYSKTHERILSSNGVISPDYEINWSENDLATMEAVSNNISVNSYKVIRNLAKYQDIKAVSQKDVELEILKTLSNDDFPRERNKSLAVTMMLYSVYSQLGKDDIANGYLVQYDKYINVAMEKLSVENLFTELLPKN